MDVSNASGYDGTTVAADACYVATRRHRPDEGRGRRDAEPAGAAGRAHVRAGVRHGGGRGAARRRHHRPRRDPGRLPTDAAVRDLPAAQLLRLPRARARHSAAAASAAGALPVAHVDLMSLGVLEAPGNYGCALAIGEGQSAGNHMSYGGPHYGFLAARSELHPPAARAGSSARRSTSTDRARLRAHAADARAAHPPREGHVEHHHQPDAAGAGAAWSYLCWLGPEGLRDVGRACLSLAEHAKRAARPAAGLRPAHVPGVRASRRSAGRAEVIAERPEAPGVHPGYPLGRDYAGLDDAAPGRRHREAHARRDRAAGRGAAAAGGGMKLIYERSQAGRRAGRVPDPGVPAADVPAELAGARRRRGCPRSPSPTWCATSPSSRRAPSASTPASTRSARAR